MRAAASLPHIARGRGAEEGGGRRSPCLLVALRPRNVEAERERFFRASFAYDPQFEYAEPVPAAVLDKYGAASDRFVAQVRRSRWGFGSPRRCLPGAGMLGLGGGGGRGTGGPGGCEGVGVLVEGGVTALMPGAGLWATPGPAFRPSFCCQVLLRSAPVCPAFSTLALLFLHFLIAWSTCRSNLCSRGDVGDGPVGAG